MRRFIPHKILRTRPLDPTWWTPECSRAIQDKTRAWKSWRRQVHDASLKNSFTQAVTNAAEIFLRARLAQEQAPRAGLTTGSLRNKEGWKHIKRAAGLGRDSDIPPLTKLFSLCYRQGVQPAQWKLAHVVPVHKKASKTLMKNYRPVSLLSIISKVMEGIINRQLHNYLEHHQILSPRQFGFQHGLGTTDLLSGLHNSWVSTIARGGLVHALAVDIAGTFDKASHVAGAYPVVLVRCIFCTYE